MILLLKILIFTLPLVCSNLPEFFGFSDVLRINGNYELARVLYFNIFSSIIIILYGIQYVLSPLGENSPKEDRGLKISKNIIIFLGLFFLINILSTLFSLFPMQSLLGGTSKGHGMLIWNNLIGLTIIFLNLKKPQLNSFITTFLYSIFIVALFGIWQYYSPSFDYGELSNRAISTLGHPNYLAGLLLLSIPLLSSKKYIKNSLMKSFGLGVIIFCLFLTKSFLAIALFLLYFIFRKIKFSRYAYLITSILLLIGAITAFLQFPEKLHSFVSRFYIWETTLHIIFSDTPRMLIGFGSETLSIFFDSFKSPELYIFENFGFTADRPHNIFLNFFYHFGIIGLGLISVIYIFIYKKLKSTAGIALGLFGIFLLFNYASIAGYLVIIILLCSLVKSKKFPQPPFLKGAIMSMYFLVMLIAVGAIYYSSKLYLAERSVYVGEKYSQALEILPAYPLYQYKNGILENRVEIEDYYLERLYDSTYYHDNCMSLTLHFPSAENYFYCGEILGKVVLPGEEEDISLYFYKKGLEKIPDLWNPESRYWKNYIIKKSISGNRFYSEKYGNIGEVLKKLDIPISQ